jgi:LacI family transcriptional regulator
MSDDDMPDGTAPTRRRPRAAATTKAPHRARGPVTLREVALAAGVSPMTVSNVVNGGGRYVREETRKRVMRAITDLNYRPASSGRNLRLGKRHAIGVIIVDESQDFLASPFIARFVSSLCRVLNENGYVMIVQGIRPGEFASAFPLRRAEADAYCVRLNAPAEQREQMMRVLERLDEPMIMIQETLPLKGTDRMTIRQDDFGGAQLLADHLLARGVRKALLVAPFNGGPMTSARIDGFKAAFAHRKDGIELAVITAASNSFADGIKTVETYLDGGNRPDAIIGTNDELALAGLRAAQNRSLKVPGDVMITGFNGFQPASYTSPSITTIVSRAAELGEAAGELLMSRLSGGAFSDAEQVLPVTFRKGDSTR